MSEIYSLLAKHFSGETTIKEELEIDEFKQQSPLEYEALRKLWNVNGKTIDTIEFNTQSALKKIEQQMKRKQQTKVIPLFTSMRQIVATIALLLTTVFIGYFALNRRVNTAVTIASNTTVKSKKVLLEDGSIVWLNKNSTLSYLKNFKTNSREVSLNGEAFFKIAKDKNRPFTVQMKTTNVTVLGTSFNIKEDSLQTLVSVKTGKVFVKANQLNKSTIITPNQTAKVDATKIESFETKNKNYLAWKTGNFEFNNTPINQVIRDLNTFYETKLNIENTKTLPNCHLTAKFTSSPITEIIEILKLTCSININKEDNSYKITKK